MAARWTEATLKRPRVHVGRGLFVGQEKEGGGGMEGGVRNPDANGDGGVALDEAHVPVGGMTQ